MTFISENVKKIKPSPTMAITSKGKRIKIER